MAVSKESASCRRKLALIIGNGKYNESFNRLTQSRNNANDLSDLLKTIDFKVTVFHDLNKHDMTTCIIDFSKTICDGDLVLFYFSGHACEVNARNYLIPVDMNIESDRDIEDFSVDIERQLERLVKRNPSWLTIFIIDCCKSYMLESTKTAKSKTTIEPKRLSKIMSPAGAFIQFAYAADQIIKDIPETGRNSLFAKWLLKNITRKNVEFTEIFRDISDEVYKESGRKQKPFSINGFQNRGEVYLNEVTKPTENPLDKEWDEQIDGNLDSVKEAQAQLKIHFDTFPNIDDVTDDKRPEIQEAKAFTKAILQQPPSGNVTERDTVCHVLKNMLKNQNIECLFFDSTHGKGLQDSSGILNELGSSDRPFVLKLNSSEGLGNSDAPKTEHGAIRLTQQLTNAIHQKQSHPILEDIKNRLSRAHNTDKRNIHLKSVNVGSLYIAYSKENWTPNDLELLPELPKRLRNNFEQFVTAKLHPLLCRPAFDISMFDERGNKTFSNQQESHEVGPPGRTKTYKSPAGWTRYGLKVLGKYTNKNNWLEPFGDPGNWYRAFHGTARASEDDFNKSKQSFEKQYAPVDAMGSIYKTGFRTARVAAYGSGVYCSPDPTFPEKGYVGTVSCDTQKGNKKFKCMLQVAVNPDGVIFTTDEKIWVVPNPQDIRSYGILIKEV